MKKISIIFGVLISLSFSGLAMAKHERKKGPCKADIEKYCKDVEPGEGRIVKCMKDNESKFSAECKADIKKHREEVKAVNKACKADREKFCKDAKPGEGENSLRTCMKEHKSELSTECKEARKGLRDNK